MGVFNILFVFNKLARVDEKKCFIKKTEYSSTRTKQRIKFRRPHICNKENVMYFYAKTEARKNT